MTETRCPLCGRETMKARMAHGPPMSAEDVATGVCLHPAHIYDMELPPCEAAGVKRITDLESECAELRKDVSALKRTYGTEVAGLTAQLRDAGEVLVQAAANASDRTAAASHDPLSEAILMGCAERCFALSGRASSEVVGNMAPPLRPIRRETP